MSRRGSALPADGRQPRQRTRANLERLESIKEAATRLFYEQGYAATDLRSIADATTMHVSSLYNYITGKEELLYLILKDGLSEITQSFDTAVASADGPVEQLRAALRAHIEHHARRRHRAWTNHVEVRALTGERLESILKMRDEYESKWVGLVEQGIRDGKFACPDPKLTVLYLLSPGLSVSRWYKPEGRVAADELAASMAEIALGGILTRNNA
jgi:TetR/AcrR family transcriptional regulator, cholesterol catabolism regulator